MYFKYTAKVLDKNLMCKWCKFDDFWLNWQLTQWYTPSFESRFRPLVLFNTLNVKWAYLRSRLADFKILTTINGRMYTSIIYQKLNFDLMHRRVSLWQNGSQYWLSLMRTQKHFCDFSHLQTSHQNDLFNNILKKKNLHFHFVFWSAYFL